HAGRRRRVAADGRILGTRQGDRNDRRWARYLHPAGQHVRLQAGISSVRSRICVDRNHNLACAAGRGVRILPAPLRADVDVGAHVSGLRAAGTPPVQRAAGRIERLRRVRWRRRWSWPHILGTAMVLAWTLPAFFYLALLFLLMLLPRMFPPVTTLSPIRLAMKTLGLIDTRAALIILFTGFQIPLAIWIMRTYLDEIPRELAESAAIDGASIPAIVARIVLPLAGPGLLAAFILAFIFNWNEFLDRK